MRCRMACGNNSRLAPRLGRPDPRGAASPFWISGSLFPARLTTDLNSLKGSPMFSADGSNKRARILLRLRSITPQRVAPRHTGVRTLPTANRARKDHAPSL